MKQKVEIILSKRVLLLSKGGKFMNTLPYGAERPVYLSINNLTKFLSGRKVLNKVSFELYGGEVLGFLGPNGSGKTTTIKIILCIL